MGRRATRPKPKVPGSGSSWDKSLSANLPHPTHRSSPPALFSSVHLGALILERKGDRDRELERETETVRQGDRQRQTETDGGEGLSPVKREEKGEGAGQMRRGWGKSQRPSTPATSTAAKELRPRPGRPEWEALCRPGSPGGALGGGRADTGAPGISPGGTPGSPDAQPCSRRVSAHPCLSFPACARALAGPSRARDVCSVPDPGRHLRKSALWFCPYRAPPAPESRLGGAGPSGPSRCSRSALSRSEPPAT